MTAASSPDAAGGQPGAGLTAADLTPGRPIVFRNATVLTMDDAHRVLRGADVLISGDRIAEVGPGLQVPEGTAEIDATGGIVMPGMIDTHRHMWQTAMRGYGADWTLTQYFVWNYLQWGKSFRPQDIYAGNLLSAIEAIDAGVTTTVDWSHNLQTVEHAEAATDALQEVPGWFVLAYGNIQAAPWEWSAAPEFRDFVGRRFGGGNDMLGFQMAFDVHPASPDFPEKAAFEVARDLGVPVTTHAGVWKVTTDDGIRLMYENGFMTPSTIYVHAASLSPDSYHRIAATGGGASLSPPRGERARPGHPPPPEAAPPPPRASPAPGTGAWAGARPVSAPRATGRARRRAHGGGERPGGQVRPPPGRHRSGQGTAGDRADGRLPPGRAWPGGLERGHAPGDPGDQGPRQPLHLHLHRGPGPGAMTGQAADHGGGDPPAMLAAVLRRHGEPPDVGPHPSPPRRPGEALIRITAAPVNPLDLLCATGTSYFGAPALPYLPR